MSLTSLAAVAFLLVVAAGVLAQWLAGPAAVLAAVASGAVAALAQLTAARLARRDFDAGITRFLRAWVAGIGVRFGGVVLLAAATLMAPEYFPPLPSAFGFLGVLIPLLFLELRLAR